MNIAVIGCGALGGFFATRFLQAGEPVQILQREGRRLEEIRREGLRLREASGEEICFFPPCFSDPEELAPADLVLVAVKAYATASVAPSIPSLLKPSGWVLTIQNGLGNAEILARHVNPRKVVFAPCTQGVFLGRDGWLSPRGKGKLVLGAFEGEPDLSDLKALFISAGIDASLSPEPRKAVWEKLMINAAINPLSALQNCSNSELLASEDLGILMKHLVDETVLLARREGIPLDGEACWERCLAVCRATASNRSSMLQDVEARRPTENRAISGALVELARKHGLEVPFTETVWRLLCHREGSFSGTP